MVTMFARVIAVWVWYVLWYKLVAFPVPDVSSGSFIIAVRSLDVVLGVSRWRFLGWVFCCSRVHTAGVLVTCLWCTGKIGQHFVRWLSDLSLAGWVCALICKCGLWCVVCCSLSLSQFRSFVWPISGLPLPSSCQPYGAGTLTPTAWRATQRFCEVEGNPGYDSGVQWFTVGGGRMGARNGSASSFQPPPCNPCNHLRPGGPIRGSPRGLGWV